MKRAFEGEAAAGADARPSAGSAACAPGRAPLSPSSTSTNAPPRAAPVAARKPFRPPGAGGGFRPPGGTNAAFRSPFARPAPPAQELRVPLRVSVEDLLRGATRYAVISSSGFTFLLPVKIEVGMRPGDIVDRKAHGDTILTVVLEQKPGLYRVDGEDLHRSAWLQQWSKPTSLRLRAPGGRFPFLGKDDVITLPRKGKKWGDGFRLRKKGRGLYAKGSTERGDLVVTVRRRSLRGSLAVLAARLSPLVAVITAIQNRTRTIQQARRARDLAKKHGPGILEGFSSFLAARRVFDDLQRYAGAPATQW